MPDFIKTLLGLGIRAGLSDREAFVHEVSGLIEEYQKDPEKARKWAKAVVDYLEDVKDNINMQSAIQNAVSAEGFPDKKQVEKLTLAIERLTKALQKRGDFKE